MGDLTLGVRLAVGGGRTSLVRLALSTLGIGVAVAVLLVAASIGNMAEQSNLRSYADYPSSKPIPGVEPAYLQSTGTHFRGKDVSISYLYASGRSSPKPAGLPAMPKVGEVYASPALVELLRSEDGELLRPRVPGEIVGTIGSEMLSMPGDLIAYLGADESVVDKTATAAYAFGVDTPDPRTLPPVMMMLLLVGAVVLLLPVFIFVSSASRIAGAERDRRLAALRLVGSGSRQVRRIAAAETLVSAFTGLLLGGLVFLVGRQFADDISFFGLRAFVSDVVPDAWLVLLIVLAIPALTVLTALFALRRTIIEPLGVVRQGRPVSRRVWWRATIILIGLVLLITQFGADKGSDAWGYTISFGAALLLVGVPVLLPWLVERVAGRIRGGPSSWMLAIRRLQLDSGTSARVVGGIAVVLAGTIALQTMLMSIEGEVSGLPGSEPLDPTVGIGSSEPISEEMQRDLAEASGVEQAYAFGYVLGYVEGSTDGAFSVQVADCETIRALGGRVDECADGDVFLVDDQYVEHTTAPGPGVRVEVREYEDDDHATEEEPKYQVTGRWTIPDDARTIDRLPDSELYASVLVTPGAVTDIKLPDQESTVILKVADDLTDDQLEGIRNVAAGLEWRAYLYSVDTGPDVSEERLTFVAVRTALYAGSVLTLMLAAVSLLVLALEHIRERRRQLAILAASGVPRGVLGRSLLWQITLPIGIGTVMALATGVGLAAMFMRLVEEPLHVDWPGVALLCVGAMALSVLVAALTLPFLRSATRLTSLRTE